MLSNGEPDLSSEDIRTSDLMYAELNYVERRQVAWRHMKESAGMIAVGSTLMVIGSQIEGRVGEGLKFLGFCIVGPSVMIGVLSADDYFKNKSDYNEQVEKLQAE